MSTHDRVSLPSLVAASDELRRGLLRGDRRGTLHAAARHIHDLLQAEACSIFVSDGSVGEMNLEAEYADKWYPPSKFQPATLKVESIPKGGLTAHLADRGRIARLGYDDIQRSPYLSDQAPRHLRSGEYWSVLAIPLVDRKDRPLGLLVACNKKNTLGEPTRRAHFTEADEAVARLIADPLCAMLERLGVRPILESVIRSIRAARDISEILDVVLGTSLGLIHADRGEIALWSEFDSDLVVAFQTPTNPEVTIGGRVPAASVAREVWEQGKPVLRGDVGDRNVRNEIAVRLEWEGKRLGVFTAASQSSYGFDSYDVELLQLLGQCAVIGYETIGQAFHFRGIVQTLAERHAPRDELLTSILDRVKESERFDAGIIYIADFAKRELYCAAHIGCEGLAVDPRTELRYGFEDPGLAPKVFSEKKGYFAEWPDNPALDQRGVDMFRIESSIVGVPLLFHDKPLGALVVWSRRNPSLAREEHIRRLAPFASLAATAIASDLSERHRTSLLLSVQRVVRELGRGLDRDPRLLSILRGISAAGFDRVRLFEYHEEQQVFTAIAWLGMDLSVPFGGHTTSPAANPYIRELVEIAFNDGTARELHPSRFGPSPDAEALGRPSDLSWGLVPLVFADRLYGYIAADNAVTRRGITQAGLEVMTLLGALAAQAMAHARALAAAEEVARREVRAELARRLDVLDLLTPIAGVIFDTDSPLTHADKIVRQTALAQEADISTLFVIEGTNQLVLKAGVAWLKGAEIALSPTRAYRLDWTPTTEAEAARQGTTSFVAVNNRALSIDSYEGLTDRFAAHVGLWDEQIYPDGVDHPETGFGCLYAVPLRRSSRGQPRDAVIGVFKIERRRNRPPFTDDDRKIFDLAAAYLSLILQALDRVQNRVFSDVAHAIGGGLGRSYFTLTACRQALNEKDLFDSHAYIHRHLPGAIDMLDHACRRLEIVLEASRDPDRMIEATVAGLWNSIASEVRLTADVRARDPHPTLDTRAPITQDTLMRLPAIAYHDLGSILGNLLANAVRHARPPVSVSIDVRESPAGRRLVFRVVDGGPGISPQILAAVEGTSYSEIYRLPGSEIVRGTGLRRVYGLAHHNKWEVSAMVNRGTTFEVVTPDFRVAAARETTP